MLDEAYRKVSGKTLREIVGKDGIMAPSTRWDTFIKWARRFYKWERFDAQERDYKLEIGANLKAAKDALLESKPDWGDRLKKALQNPDNNLLYQYGHPFLNLLDSNPEQLEEALRQLWETNAAPLRRNACGGSSRALTKSILRSIRSKTRVWPHAS